MSSSLHAQAPICPDTTKGETKEDCPWAGVAREMIQNSSAPDLAERFKKALPHLYSQIKTDSTHTAFKNLWGQSLNFDENAKEAIVHPAILDVITQLMVVPPLHDKVIHAGAEHVYGYLLSNLKTPYGFKRARWLKGDLDQGFGLHEHELSPATKEGTLFSNLTFFLGKIAFRSEPAQLQTLVNERLSIAKDVRNYHSPNLNLIRLEEKVKPEKGPAYVIRTDFVPFPHSTPSGNSHLLIYSILNQETGTSQLITAFPVGASVVEAATEAKNLGDNRHITLRYNAYVSTLMEPRLTGSRRVVRETYGE